MPAMKDRGTAFWFVSYYLFERVGEQIAFTLCLIPQVATIARAEPSQSWELLPGVPNGQRGHKPSSAFPGCINRKLGPKWSSWHPYGGQAHRSWFSLATSMTPAPSGHFQNGRIQTCREEPSTDDS